MNSILVLAFMSIVTLFTGVWNWRKGILPVVLIGIVAALGLLAYDWGTAQRYFNDMLYFDNFAIAFSGLLMGITLLIFLVADHYYKDKDSSVADIYGLILFTLIGGITMASYSNLAMLFIGIETLSISLYVLAGSRKLDLASNEASIKYFMMGAFSTGFLLFGMALIYGATGSFHLEGIKNYVIANVDSLPYIFMAGVMLMFIGLAFKVSAAPFHFWAPDVYEGAPTIVTTFMATVVKTAGFAAMLRIFYLCFGGIVHDWFYVVWIVTALTMTIGNLSAIFQKGVKRLLAYSSIANAGYMMIAVLALNDSSPGVLFYYAAAYSLATICAFGVTMLVADARGNDNFESFHGLARNNPLLTAVLVIAFLSLAGIPPLSGFFAKYYLFASAVENNYLWIVVIAILNSLVGVYYYFRVIVAAFAHEPMLEKVYIKPAAKWALIIAMALTVLLGLFPGVFTSLL